MPSDDAMRRWDEMYEMFDARVKGEINCDWFQSEDRIEIEKYYNTGGKRPYDRFILDFTCPNDIVVHAPSRSAEGLVVNIRVIVDFVNNYFNVSHYSGEYFNEHCVRKVGACEYRTRSRGDYQNVAEAARTDEEIEIENRNRGDRCARCIEGKALLRALDRFA